MKLYCGWFIFTTLVSLVVSDVRKENPDDQMGLEMGYIPKVLSKNTGEIWEHDF